jgi:hypothetical protein
MKKLPILFFLLISLTAGAQWLDDPFLSLPDKNLNPKAGIRTCFDAGSNALTAQFLNTVLFSTDISESARQSVVGHLKANNLAGGFFESGAFSSFNTKKKGLNFYVDYKYRAQLGIKFTPDMYNLLAFGNANFAGKTAVFTGTDFQKTVYQELQGGFYGYLSKYRKVIGGITLGLIGANNDLSFSFNRGSLYTSEEGDTLKLDADLNSSRTAGTGYFNYQGVGLALNGFISWQARNASFTISANDIGFVHWGKNTQSLHLNDQWNYTGAEVGFVDNAFIVSNFETLPDTLAAEINNGWGSKGITKALPMRLILDYNWKATRATALNIALEQLFFYHELPQAYLLAGTKVGKYVKLNYGAGAGGYSPFGILAGIGLYYKKWQLNALTSHLEGLVIPAHAHGESAYIQLVKGVDW